MPYIIVVGEDQAIGPFKSEAEANKYGSEFEDEDRFHKQPWRVVPLGLPMVMDRDEDHEDYEDEDYDKEEDRWDRDEWDDEDSIRNRMFADPGGNSALRAATKDNPRIHPCPTCHRPNLLTPEDRRLGYCCDRCADRAERGVDY